MMKEQTDATRQRGGYGRFLASALYARLGQLQDRIGSLTAAEACYRKALSRRPRQFSALAGLGRLLLRERRFEEAVPIWREVVALRPASASMAFQLSRALHRSGQLEQAAASYLHVIALDSAHEKATTAVVEVARRLAAAHPPADNSRGLRKAAWLGHELLKLRPEMAKPGASVASIADAICAAAARLAPQQPAAALEYFDAALELAPGLVEAQRGVVLCCERLGDLEKALAVLQRQLDANPQAVEARLTIERLRALLGSSSSGGAVPDAGHAAAMMVRARGLVAGDGDGSAAVGAIDPEEREALVARARRLMDPDSGARDDRERLLARARQLLDPDSANTDDREVLLARARQLVDSESGGTATDGAVDQREGLLARARRLTDPDSGSTDDREGLLARARQLVDSASGAAATDDVVDQREALITRARLLMASRGVSSTETLRNVSETALAEVLARAEELLTGRESLAAAGPADGRTPRQRDAVTAAARRGVAGERLAAPVNAEEREALLERAKVMARAAATAGEPLAIGDDAPLGTPKEGIAAAEVDGSVADLGADGPIALPRLLRLARHAHHEGRLDDAELLYRQIIDCDATHVQALTLLSRLLMQQRRWKDAVDMLIRLDVAQPHAVEPKRLLGSALLRDDRFEAAARVYTALSHLEPDDPTVWKSLGQVEKRLGNWVAARTAWSRLCELSPEDQDGRFELAVSCQRAGDDKAAEKELRVVLDRDPDHKGALTFLGRMSLATDPDASLLSWLHLAALDPDALEPMLQIGRIHLRQQRLDEAEAAFRKVIGAHPTHAESLASLARIIGERDPEETARLFELWAQHAPDNIAPWLSLGRSHVRAGRFEPAAKAFQRVLDIAPSNVEAMTNLGRLYSNGGKLDEALTVWSRLAELAPDSVEARLQIARVHHARQDHNVEPALNAVLSIDPDNREALRRLAQHKGHKRETIDQALELWERLAELDRGAVVPIVQRGMLLERHGRSADAEREYRRAFAVDPRNPIALSSLGQFLRNRQRWQEAADVHTSHLLVEPDRVDILVGLGRCLDRLDRIREAEELYSRALTLDPDHVTALGYRGRLLRTRGQVDGAIADFRRVCELEPSNADAWHELIFYLAGAEREVEAHAALDAAEEALGPTPSTWTALGRAAAAALFEERAIVYFERAIAAQPQNAGYHAQLGLHYFRQGVLDGAFHHWLDSREIDPNDVEVAKGLFDATCALRELGYDHMALRRAPRSAGKILIPERLFDRVRHVAETSVKPYDPVPRSVVAISATLAPGGAERQLVNMMRGLSAPRFGLDLSLFCISLATRLRRDFFLPVLEGTGVDVVSLDAVPDAEECLWHPDVAPFAELIRHFPNDMVLPIAYWLKEFRCRRPQVVHAWQDSTNLTAVVAALLAGVPRIVLCCRSVHPDNPRRRLRRFMNDAYRAVLDHPAVVLSNNSRAGADDYAEWLGISSERIEVVYNGVDFDRLRSSAEETEQARRQLGIPVGAPVLGGVFRMSEEKRPLLWLDVAAAVARQDQKTHFVVCGDGPMRDEMVRHAVDLGIRDRVHLPGAQSNIGSWYRMMDVVMLTSRHEGLPNVLLEAQSLGIPVVAPDVGGMSEVVEQGITGWTIRDAAAEHLAERVMHCLSNKAWRRAAVARAPAFVRERFGIPTMLRRNLEVYGIPAERVLS